MLPALRQTWIHPELAIQPLYSLEMFDVVLSGRPRRSETSPGRCAHLAEGQPALPARLTNTKRLTRIPLRVNADAGNGPRSHQPLSEAEWM